MKFMALAATAIAVVIALATFVRLTPHETAADQPSSEAVGISDNTATRSKPSVAPSTQSAPAATHQDSQAAFTFRGVEYFHRSSERNSNIDLHEFTPADQADLGAWVEMVSVIRYHHVNDVDGLAQLANLTLQLYQELGGQILATDSVAATEQTPAEHLLVGVLFDPGFIEAVFTRFRMTSDGGTAVLYSRRVYGSGVGDKMSAWLNEHGPTTGNGLMAWDAIPTNLQRYLKQ